MGSYLDRYLEGDREQVWFELFNLGGAIRSAPLFSDALAVTEETMTRVRENIKELIKRLDNLGYKFGVYPLDGSRVDGYVKPYNPPPSNISIRISEYETLDGIKLLPLSLRVFWEVVGDVDFTGYHPMFPQSSDPLIIYPVEAIDATYSSWRFSVDEGDVEAGQFLVPLAPDYYHKDNVSGGSPYGLRVPNVAIDGIFENERLQTTFVNYLRICFRYGGFPGLQWSKQPIRKEILALTDGLLPI